MKYVLIRDDGFFVTPAGSVYSYSKRLQDARVFNSKEEAEKERCGNESAIPLESAFRR